ncbi:tRNA 2-thiocytidine(32) synthetase TtcA [Candidatus Dependentiae bacterium]|nr:tRNA 2-thiocytidine(32) synthetase TtcA [Candidatus Dependentiae bacterium]
MRKILGAVKAACIDYNMINEGDRIAVGVSGGKDSLVLINCLIQLRYYLKRSFELHSVIVDNNFPDMDYTELLEYLKKIDIPYTFIKTNIYNQIFIDKPVKYPCSLCSRLRKGIIADNAVKINFNKIALGHHLDDAVNTLFMNMIYEGRIATFEPVTYLSQKNIYMIRPMIYLNEEKIHSASIRYNMPVFKNKCPVTGKTKREYVNSIIKKIAGDTKHFRMSMLSALKNKEQLSLWF